jgi:hypothetical protein
MTINPYTINIATVDVLWYIRAMNTTIKIDEDISGIIAQIERNTLSRGSYAYELGKKDALEEFRRVFSEHAEDSIKKAQYAADVFCGTVAQLFPGIGINEVRVGIDYSTSDIIALLVLSAADKVKKREVQYIARAIESALYAEKTFFGSIWTLVDQSLDAGMIERDFPIFRTIDKNA